MVDTSVVQNWAIFLAIAGAVYLFTRRGRNGETRGRSLQRATNNAASNVKGAAQWSEEETKSKSKQAGKATKAKAPRKSVKKAVQEAGDKAEAYLSAASSNAGADADDDTPPTASPSGRDVSDMLEPQAPKSVLKISASEKQARPAKPQPQRTESATETKKQRQNRKKKEEEKAAREAAEEERKKLLEQQRRTAREARGEAARNGLQPAQAPTSNAWSSGSAPAAKSSLIGGQLLDTLDNVAEVAPSAGGATNGTTSESTKYGNLPSEEDQLRMAMEESAWTTVPKGRKKAKKEAAEEGSDSGAQEAAPAPVKAAPVKAAPVKKAENTKPASRFDVLSQQITDVGDPRDSDWPVV
ncbi:hypothetical protein DM02DRAFT_207304 [Periconia macrospinosa]|uniref:Uncharacterized protein n=1 Tax=Periconia macrospinosa TaxID=97972 RepID=A0A2V1D8S8_9PLEO|nr:hypothetical protein DM02DRAFT_207304 [Periconia macrospinosa]